MRTVSHIIVFISIILLLGCSTKRVDSKKIETSSTLLEVHEKISATLFTYVDKNNNQKVTEEEFVNYSQEKSKMQEQRHINAMIESCDRNGDKKISLEEIPEDIRMMPVEPEDVDHIRRQCFINKNLFLRQDSNHDNILTAQELSIRQILSPPPMIRERDPKSREQFLTKKYNNCDKNSDGTLTLKEATEEKCGIPSNEFTKADSNHDELLSLQEILDIAKREEPKRPTIVPREIPSSAPKEIRLMMSMYKCDTDEDGKLNEAELTSKSCGFSKKDFLESDHNKDGYFSSEDMIILNILRNFKRIDKNRDSILDFNEFKENSRF